MIYYIRCYVEVSSLDAAKIKVAAIVKVCSALGLVEDPVCTDYWKIPEFKQIAFELHGSSGVSIEQIGNLLCHGWHLAAPSELIWNSGEGKSFCVEDVKWAHIEAL